MEEPFWSGGLRFACTRCSRCCTGEPGYVFLSPTDIKSLLSGLGLDFRTFLSRYCRFVDMGEHFTLSLKERPDHSCVFWETSGCSVYETRPIQCSTYPFWASILESPASWQEEASWCPGLGSGRLRSRAEIEEALSSRRAAGLVRIERRGARPPEFPDETEILGS